MARLTLAQVNADVQAVKGDVADIKGMLSALLAQQADAPAKVERPAPEAPKADNEFVTWLRDTAPARQARKESNREMAAWLRSKDLPTNGPVWEAAKKGNRSVRSLRALAKKA